MKTKRPRFLIIISMTVFCLLSSHKVSAQKGVDPIITMDQEVQKVLPLYESGDYAKAKSILQAVISKNNKNADAHYALANVLSRMNNNDKATDEIVSAIDLCNNNAEYHYTYARISLNELRVASLFRMPSLSSIVKEELLTAIKLNPKHKLAIITLGNYYFQAPGIAGGDSNKAIEQANNLLKLDEKEGHRLLCQIYTSTSNYSKAI